jgi:GNAT superfamily N-acetyltransferase
MTSDGGLQIETCPPEDVEAALAMLYRRMGSRLQAELVVDTLGEIDRGELDLSGIWVAWRRGRMVGAMLTQALAGRAVALWPPEVVPHIGRGATAAALVRAALRTLRGGGVRLVQALVDRSSPPGATTDLIRGGLPRVTELIYMTRDTALPLRVARDVPRFSWVTYGKATESEFRRLLHETYIGSLDIPELEGTRSLEDVLASHQAGGRFDPSRWLMGRLDAEPTAAAIVLLSELPERGAWEVAYLGLTPSARGRGLGRMALAHALRMARPQTPRLELAVDVRNLPAERLYKAAGFVPHDRRAVHLTVIPAD